MGKKKNYRHNYEFIDSLVINDATYNDYLDRFKKIALSVFEWVNLPKSMNAMYLERCLYYLGQATLLKTKEYGFINTRCSTDGSLNIYGLPVRFNCFSYDFQTSRSLYTGLKARTEAQREYLENSECVLVQNNWERIPTARYNGIICI